MNFGLFYSTGVGKRVFQRLPRYLRRRCTSHNVKRLPHGLRRAATAETEKLVVPRSTVLLRKKMRRTRLTQAQMDIRRQGKTKWLRTHLWHAKRFHMTDIWGYRLAVRPAEKCRRGLYKAAIYKTLLSDISYMQSMQVTASRADLSQVLEKLTGQPWIYNENFWAGQVVVGSRAYEEYPVKFVAPIQVFCSGVNGDQFSLLLSIHPSASELLISVLDTFSTNLQTHLQIDDKTTAVARFSFRGPRSHATLQHILRPVNVKVSEISMNLDETDASSDHWIKLRNITSPAVLPSRCMFSLSVDDPRNQFPPKLAARIDAEIEEQTRTLCHIIPPTIYSIKLFDAENDQVFQGNNAKEIQIGIPILLMSSFHLNHSSAKDAKFSDGYDFMCPAHMAKHFWRSFVYAGCRVGGLREERSLGFESGTGSFPYDYPDTVAYSLQASNSSGRKDKKLEKARQGVAASIVEPHWVVREKSLQREFVQSVLDNCDDPLKALSNLPCMFPVELHFPSRGVSDFGSQILVPSSPQDIEAMHSAIAADDMSLLYMEHLKWPSCKKIGYCTSGDYSLSRACGYGIGVCNSEAIRQIVLSSKVNEMAISNVALVLNQNGRALYPVHIKILS